MFVSIKGGSYQRFRRALATGNPLLVRTAAAELGQVPLEDALEITLLLLRAEPASYRAAAVRWHGRFCMECRPSPADAALALAALSALQSGTRRCAAAALAELCEAHGLPRAADAAEHAGEAG